MERTPWQRLLELAYPVDGVVPVVIAAEDGREAVVEVLETLRKWGELDDGALVDAVDSVARNRGLAW